MILVINIMIDSKLNSHDKLKKKKMLGMRFFIGRHEFDKICISCRFGLFRRPQLCPTAKKKLNEKKMK